MVLPAATFAEKDGTFTNTERRVQRVRKVIEPIGQARADWSITSEIARRMGGKGFAFDHPAQIMEEMAALAPIYRGITYRRLERGGLQWPCLTTKHAGTPILHVKQFSGGKGKFMPLTFRPPAEVADEQYPLLLTTERNLFQFHTGTMTRKVDGINELCNEERVEINPQDAKSLGLADGDMMRLASRRGALTAKVKVTPASPPGVLCLSFHFAETPTNILTNPALDPVAKIPELKVCAVRTEPVAADKG